MALHAIGVYDTSPQTPSAPPSFPPPMPDIFSAIRTRTLACLCVCFCMLGGVVLCQDDPADKNSEPPTFQQLKIEGAARSKYLKRQSKAEDNSSKVPMADHATFQKVVQPILKQACVGCHGPDTEEGSIRIDTLNPDFVTGNDVNWWLEILAVLSNGEMPPPDADELSDEDRGRVVDWLSNEIQTSSSVRRATGGHSSFRRMTRYEYNYAMQDILGRPWNFAKDLPPEAHSEDGFQNSSEMLHMSVTQLETYRRLALRALRRTTVRGDRPPVIHWNASMQTAAEREWPKQAEEIEKLKKRFKDDPQKQQQEVDRLKATFNKPHRQPYYLEKSTGRTARANWRYAGARYAFAPVEAAQPMPDSFEHVAIITHGRNHNLTVELGERVPDEGMIRVRARASRSTTGPTQIPSLQLEFGFQASNEGKAVVRLCDQDTPVAAIANAPKIYEWMAPLGEIYPRNSFRKTAKMGGLPSPSEFIRFVNSSASPGDIHIDYVDVAAPVYKEWPPQSHKRIFVDSVNCSDESVYAREVLTVLMTRAWRRSLSEDDIQQKMKLFHAMRPSCDSFEDAMLEVLATVLSSPRFLYVVCESPAERAKTKAKGTATKPEQLSPYELATRLSLFLWCSVPDDELLQLAEDRRLRNSDALMNQVKRLLADSRSERFASHFVHQWLDMQLLDFLAFDKNVDPLLKESMQREPVAFFQEMLRHDDSVLNFIHADYTIANERLARHCGFSNVHGNHFRRVPLNAAHRRGGLMTQAGLLAMNSDGDDSHPLKRGVWLLESLLNDPPPPPPPAVPEIDLADPEIAKLTLKQRIENHRDHAACMSCHAKIDPWGIAFENYDAQGRYRDKIAGKPVDATSLLFNNQKLDGVDGLKRFLLINRQDQFVRAIVHKLATYALGRPLAFSDYASIDNITTEVRKRGDGLATIIRQLVASELFQKK